MRKVQPAFPVDLQLHSTASDGTESPAELVAHAARRGLQVIALTDHDSVLGVDAALAAGREHGLWVVPAIEFSTRSEPTRDFDDINILGYNIDPHHPELEEVLQQVIDSRIAQKVAQVARLQSYGVTVPVDEVLASAGGVPGRVHIARVALAHNPERFASIGDVFDQFLAVDAPNSTYVGRSFSLRVEDAIELTHAAGGIAVLAHPGSYTQVRDIDDAVRRMQQVGLDGIEIRYTYGQNRGHRGASDREVANVVAHFDDLARELGLLRTGGSDYHGTTKPGILPGQAGLTEAEWTALADKLEWSRSV